MATKDGSKLFADVQDETYDKMFSFLEEMRIKYPSYRDDQLLMFMLCQAEEYLSSVFVPEGFTKFE